MKLVQITILLTMESEKYGTHQRAQILRIKEKYYLQIAEEYRSNIWSSDMQSKGAKLVKDCLHALTKAAGYDKVKRWEIWNIEEVKDG